MITRTTTEHTRALLNYLPGGPLFTARNLSTSNIYKLMTGIAGEFKTADELIKYYRTEIVPSLSEQLIPEWEAALAIPDDCFKATGNIVERRTHVLAKLASLGIQTVADFETLALIFGVTVTVVPGVEEAGSGDPDNRFRIYILHAELPTDTFPYSFPIIFGSKVLSIISCLFAKLKPANCDVIFRQLGWNLAGGLYETKSFDFSSEDLNPRGVFFKPDGLKMYMIGSVSDSLHQYTLSTAWDVTTASYDSISFSVATEEIFPQGVYMRDDGLKFYVIGSTSPHSVDQYSMSTAWDLSTASYDSKAIVVGTQDIVPAALFFRDDGFKMYMLGDANNTVYQYSLTTAWDVSTASYDSVSFSVATQETNPTGIFFKPDGSAMFVVGYANDTVYEYALTALWDLSTASYASKSLSVATETGFPSDVQFRQDGYKMYIVDSSLSEIFQYKVE